MSRADRISRIAIVTSVVMSIVLAISACVSRGEKKKVDTPLSSAPAIVTPQAASGDVDSVQKEAPVVTFASAQTAYTQQKYAEAEESFSAYVEHHPRNA